MLKVTGVYKEYVTKKKKGLIRSEKEIITAVSNLNLEINKGEIVGLLGLNGAGKTTTIKMLSTLLSPTKGTITIDGIDTEKDAQKIKKRINMIAGGERMLYWRLTGRENLVYFGRLYGLKSDELNQRINHLMTVVGLEKSVDIPVEQYSKGMKQRLQIARGLINDPSYLFLDEPTLGLDVPVAKQLRLAVHDLAKVHNKAILLTTHYLEEVEELCDRVYIIDKGWVIEHGAVADIVNRIVKRHILTMTVNILTSTQQNHLVKSLEVEGVTLSFEGDDNESTLVEVGSSGDVTAKVLAACSKAGIIVKELATKKPGLEDAILQLAQDRGD